MTGTVRCAGLAVQRGGRPVLHEVNLTVTPGEWVSLVGPNGCGKTTLLHAMVGLVPFDGEVEVAGLTPARSPRRAVARAVALMPQRPVVPDGVTVRELIRLGRTPHIPRFGTETAHDDDVVDAVIARLGLGGLADRLATALSGGELQRVVLGRSLAQEPRVLLLDEPTSALDIGHQQQVLDLVDSMRRDAGITVIAAMHDLTAAAHYGERLVMMAQGQIVADGSAAEVLTAQRVSDVYGARVEVLGRPDGPAVVPLRGPGDVMEETMKDCARRGARTVVLGGVRSGKSRYAESLLDRADVTVVAAGAAADGDAEWASRVAEHRRRRPPAWVTVETTDVTSALREASGPVLIECLGTWLTARMDLHGVWDSGDLTAVEADVADLVSAWAACEQPVVAVSNEVGSGVVPASVSGRLFRDSLGRLNTVISDASETVVLMVAGQPLTVKGARTTGVAR
ncbi:bifunctional adenosylcobinamide kinase/adenosylcobinamide-phosphate guanylyltransferase [Gordonia sp. VNK1]|jgi:iron complex transport system ATP-binding protein|uniref:bifunctional adenosylcobinamide kinase/adenosylcobinamide-phosphate guanylyltransferase n=1 Tax=Gordonia oleivorans TaxID=3156618 RepID=UPI0032B3531C